MNIQEAMYGRKVKTSGLGNILTGDKDHWPSEVHDIAQNQHPWLGKFNTTVHLEESRSPTGAVGFLQITPKSLPSYLQSSKELPVITVPIVIRDKELSPLDLLSFKGQFHPLTEDRVNRIIRLRSAFGKADSQPISVPLTEFGDAGSDTFQTLRDRGRGLKVRSLSSVKLSSAQNWKQRFESLSEETGSELQKLIKEAENSREETTAYEIRNTPQGLRGRVHYSVSPTGKTFGEWEKLSAATVTELAGPTLLSKVLLSGQEFLIPDGAQRQARDRAAIQEILAKEAQALQPPPEPIQVSGKKTYKWRTKTSGIVEGRPVYWLRVTSEGGKRSMYKDRQQFGLLTKEGELIEVDEAEPIEETSEEAPKDVKKATGEKGVRYFVWEDKDGELSAVKARGDRVSKTEDGKETLAPVDGGEHVIKTDSSLKDAWLDETKSTPAIQVPSEAQEPAEVKEPGEDGEVAGDELATEDGSTLEEDGPEAVGLRKTDIKLTSRDGKIRIRTTFERPNDLETNSLAKEDAISELINLGASQEGATAVVEAALSGANATFTIKNPIITKKVDDTEVTKVAKELRKKLSNAVAQFRSIERAITRTLPERIKTNLTKELPFIKESEGATECLDISTGMGFLTESTLLKFIEFIPDLEKSLSKLCTLLLSARIGLEELDEEAVKDSVTALDKIISGLRKIEYQLLL